MNKQTAIKTAIIIVIAFAVLVILNENVSASGNGNYPPPANGDWVIDNATVVENETIILNGNLIINNGGNLTLKNATLIFNCTSDGQFGITVNSGGEFHILNNSNLTAFDTNYEFKFLVNSGSIFEMRDSELSECGYYPMSEEGTLGLTIKTNNSVIQNNEFHNNYNGINLYSSMNNISGNNIHDNLNISVYLLSSNNNSITNNSVYDNGYGIRLSSSSNNNIINNNVYSNNGYGIYLSSSSNNNIINNNVYSNNGYGIRLSSSNNNKMRNNTINDNTYNFGVYGNQDIDTSNTINGKPIYYLVNQNNLTISENAGYVGLISCDNIRVENVELKNNSQGILLVDTINSTIDNSNIYDNIDGIYFYSSSNIQITNSQISNSTNEDFYLTSNSKNNIAISTTFSTISVSSDSELIIKNYLEVSVIDRANYSIQFASVSFKDNGNEFYLGNTNSQGKISWVLTTDRIYDGSSTATENTTTVQVSYNNFNFNNNPRDVNMQNSHTEIFQSNENLPYYYWQNGRTISAVEIYENTTILCDGNLIIANNGNLTLKNTTLMINPSFDGQYRIEVQNGGQFYIYYSKINSSSQYKFLFWVNKYTSFVMKNSELRNCGYTHDFLSKFRDAGLWIVSSNGTIENNTFADDYFGIHLYSSSITIKNNTFYDNYAGILAEMSSSEIFGNVFYDGDYGIIVSSGKSAKIQENEFYSNKIGIYSEGVGESLMITNNEIHSNDYGIYFSSTKSSIQENLIYGNDIGIYLSDTNCSIQENDIYENGRYGIYLIDSSIFQEIINNTISDNFYAIYSINSKANFNGNKIYYNNNAYYFNNSEINFENEEIIFNNRGIDLFYTNLTTKTSNISNNNIYNIKSENSSFAFYNTSIFSSKDNLYLVNSTFVSINSSFAMNIYNNNSMIIIKNYLQIIVLNENSTPLKNADILVLDGNNTIYKTLGYGGNDTKTDENGTVRLILLMSKTIYENRTEENLTFVEIKYNGDKKFVDNFRYVDMTYTNEQKFIYDKTKPQTNLSAFPIYNNYVSSKTFFNLSSEDNLKIGKIMYRIFNGTWGSWIEYNESFNVFWKQWTDKN